MKEAYIRRTGLMQSDKTTVRVALAPDGQLPAADDDHLRPRVSGGAVHPHLAMFVNDPAMPMDPYPCEEATETAVERGRVPHFLPARALSPA